MFYHRRRRFRPLVDRAAASRRRDLTDSAQKLPHDCAAQGSNIRLPSPSASFHWLNKKREPDVTGMLPAESGTPVSEAGLLGLATARSGSNRENLCTSNTGTPRASFPFILSLRLDRRGLGPCRGGREKVSVRRNFPLDDSAVLWCDPP